MNIQTFLQSTGNRYRFKAQDQGPVIIDIFDEIDNWWGYGVRQMAFDLTGKKDVKVRINSLGGQVEEGLAIANVLSDHPGEVVTQGIGMVASIATAILLAGDRVTMAANSFMMIHKPWSVVWGGDSDDFRKTADNLEVVEGVLEEMYVTALDKRGKLVNDSREDTLAKVREWMAVEKWFSAGEALEAGFIDEISQEEPVEFITEETAAHVEAQILKFEHPPAALMNKIKELKPKKMDKNDGILDKIRNLFQEQEAQEATPETPETTIDEISLEEAQEALKAAGFTITGPDDIEDREEETPDVVEEQATEVPEEAPIMALQAEIDSLKAAFDSLPKPGLPSGGGTAESEEQGRKVNPKRKKAFDSLAAQVMKHARQG